MKTYGLILCSTWLASRWSNLVFWTRFRRMKEHWQGHEVDLEKVPVQWKKESSFVVDASLQKGYSLSTEWYPIRLSKGLWLVPGSFIILNLLWYTPILILWDSCICLMFYIKMPLCSPFPGYLSVLVMDRGCFGASLDFLECPIGCIRSKCTTNESQDWETTVTLS